jgi:hypothetical protein
VLPLSVISARLFEAHDASSRNTTPAHMRGWSVQFSSVSGAIQWDAAARTPAEVADRQSKPGMLLPRTSIFHMHACAATCVSM